MPDNDDKLIFEAYEDNKQQITRAAEFALQAIKEIDGWHNEQKEALLAANRDQELDKEEFSNRYKAILAELYKREEEAIKKVIAEHMPADPYDNETWSIGEALFRRLHEASEPQAEIMGDPLYELAVHLFGDDAADELMRISQIAYNIKMF